MTCDVGLFLASECKGSLFCLLHLSSCKMVNMPHGGSSPAYRCVCPPGFSGSRCEIVPPTANATSLCSRADALATATAGSSLCLHGSRCFDAPSGPVCACPFGWRGARCEHDLDECLLATEAFASLEEGRSGGSVGAVEDVLCNPYGAHRGVCINLPGTYRCNCSLGYAGQNCQIRVSLWLNRGPFYFYPKTVNRDLVSIPSIYSTL